MCLCAVYFRHATSRLLAGINIFFPYLMYGIQFYDLVTLKQYRKCRSMQYLKGCF
jgi:hypothetical protein